jgi:Holliday junction resolvasome RuvABC endonuclease subunit
MAGAVGVDPGARYTGLALVRRGAWVTSDELRGRDGTAKDWGKLARTARELALQVSAFVLEHEPEVVGVETMVDQRGERRTWSNRHTTSACCQAVYDVAAAQGWAELIVWQDAFDVLHMRKGYGTLKYLLEQGRAGGRVGAPAPLDEHQASAVCHAVWAEQRHHSRLAGR